MAKSKAASKKTSDTRILRSLHRRIRAAAHTLSTGAPGFAKGKGKAYEAWVMFEIASDLQRTRRVTAKDSAGKATRQFRLRGGPGHLAPPTVPPDDQPTYFAIANSLGRSELELHNSLEHRGKSGVEHELDLSIMKSGHVDWCRLGPGSSVYEGELVFGAELKAHKAQISKAVARGVLGVALDLPRHSLVLSREYQHDDYIHVVETYFTPSSLHLITSAPQHADCEKLLRTFGCRGVGAVAPNNPGSISSLLHDVQRTLS